jgi:phage gp46-like protein
VTDIRVVQTTSLTGVWLDWLLLPTGVLDESLALATAVIVALGTDRVADVDDPLPGLGDSDRRGWWGDLDAVLLWNGWPIGSRLWLLERGKITDAGYQFGSTVTRAQLYAQEALTPFVTQGICSAVDVLVWRSGPDRLDCRVVLYRGPKQDIVLEFQGLWSELLELKTNVAISS